MLAFSPPSFPNFGWPLEDPMFNNIYAQTETSNPLLLHCSSLPQQPQVGHGESLVFEPTAGDATTVKKVNHNASERDRRKKINSLYSSLRSLLPPSEQAKKLSIPNTVSRVLKYIPELQNEVERLTRKKEELLSKNISKEGELIDFENQRESTIHNCLSTVSVCLLGDEDLMIQISTVKANNILLSEAIEIIQNDGFHFVNASSFTSLGERVFYNLHFQVKQPDQIVENEILRRRLTTLCERRENRIPSSFISSWKFNK